MPTTVPDTNTRQTWQQITQRYADKWVLMKDVEYDRGELASAVVFFFCDYERDINRFVDENPDQLPLEVTCYYIGETMPRDDTQQTI